MTEMKIDQLFNWVNHAAEEDLDKLECKELTLTDGDQIDNPLVNKYSDLNQPASLKMALIHSVTLVDLESLACRKSI